MRPAPQMVHDRLRGREEIPSPREHTSRHRNLLAEEDVPQNGVVRNLSRGQERGVVDQAGCGRRGQALHVRVGSST